MDILYYKIFGNGCTMYVSKCVIKIIDDSITFRKWGYRPILRIMITIIIGYIFSAGGVHYHMDIIAAALHYILRNVTLRKKNRFTLRERARRYFYILSPLDISI